MRGPLAGLVDAEPRSDSDILVWDDRRVFETQVARDQVNAIARAIDPQHTTYERRSTTTFGILKRFDGAHQNRAWVALDLGDRVEAVVHAVDQINVRDASPRVHQRPALAWP